EGRACDLGANDALAHRFAGVEDEGKAGDLGKPAGLLGEFGYPVLQGRQHLSAAQFDNDRGIGKGQLALDVLADQLGATGIEPTAANSTAVDDGNVGVGAGSQRL